MNYHALFIDVIIQILLKYYKLLCISNCVIVAMR